MSNVKTHGSLWLATSEPAGFPALAGDLEADVAIIGAGITGLTAAARLADSGRRVVVVDRARVGGGETGHTTAHLTEVIDGRYAEIGCDFGNENAARVAGASRASIAEIERLADLYRLDCGFGRVPGYLYTERAEDVGELEKELEAARRAGVEGELVRDVPLPFPVAAAIVFPDQAQFHPLRYLAGLAGQLAGRGVRIFEGTVALTVEEGGPCRVHTDRGVIAAERVFVAANVPVNDRMMMHTRLAAYRTYALAYEVADGAVADGLFWDTDEPYHYTRTQRIDGQTFLIVGGEDHKTGLEPDTPARYGALEDYARIRFGVTGPAYSWSGQIIEPVDRLPFIGLNSGSSAVYIATGYSGNGMTFGTVAGMVVADLVTGQENPYAELFQPSRFTPLASAARFLRENVDYPRHFVLDRLTSFNAEHGDPEQVAPGHGTVLVINGEKLAVSRDEETGVLHVLSPVCTHLACDVRWNAAERTWDCPCHGSRFAPDGRVLNGPAVQPLQKLKMGSG